MIPDITFQHHIPERWRQSMSLIIYLVGFIFVIGGIAWALVLFGLKTLYVVIVTVILVGLAIISGVTRTHRLDRY